MTPSRSERSLLELPPGVAAFAIERLGFVRERPVEWRHTIVRGDRFSVVAEFSAGIGYRLDVGALARGLTIRMDAQMTANRPAPEGTITPSGTRPCAIRAF